MSFGAAAAAAALAVSVVAASVGAAAAAPPPRPTALDWGGRYFVERGAFEAWLRERHANFNTWERRHPAALATLLGATKVPAPLTTGDLPHVGSQRLAIGGAVVASPGVARRTTTLQVVLAALAAVLFALAAVPMWIRPHGEASGLVANRGLVAIQTHRLILTSAGASIIAALAVVRFVGG